MADSIRAMQDKAVRRMTGADQKAILGDGTPAQQLANIRQHNREREIRGALLAGQQGDLTAEQIDEVARLVVRNGMTREQAEAHVRVNEADRA